MSVCNISEAGERGEVTYFSHVLGVLDVRLWSRGRTDVSYDS